MSGNIDFLLMAVFYMIMNPVFSTILLCFCRIYRNWDMYESKYFGQQRSCCRACIQFYRPLFQVNQGDVGSVVIKGNGYWTVLGGQKTAFEFQGLCYLYLLPVLERSTSFTQFEVVTSCTLVTLKAFNDPPH